MNELQRLMLQNYSNNNGYDPIDYRAKIFDTPTFNGKGFGNMNIIQPSGDTTPIGADSGTPWGLIASLGAANIGGFIGGMSPDYNSSNLAGIAGNGQSSVMGMNYTTQNTVDRNAIMKEYDSRTRSEFLQGKILGGVSRLIWGRNKQKDAIEQQHQQAIRTNDYNRDMTMTNAMQQNFMKKYGNQENQILFTENGKDENGGTFALTQPFETKDHAGKLTTYFGGKLGTDSNLDYIEDGDTVFSLKTPIGKAMTALSMKINRNKGNNLEIANRVARPTVEKAKSDQKYLRSIGLLPQEQVAHAKWGLDDWGNLVQTVAGLGTAFGGYLQAKGSKIHQPDIRVADDSNKYIRDLYAIQPDNLAINRELRNAEARGRYQLNSAGGLGTGQKALANVALTSNTQNNIATAMAQAQDRFNALQTQRATAGLNSTLQSAQRNQQGLQYNNASYQQAASARQNIMRDYLAQVPAALGTFFKGLSTSKMHNDMMSLYKAGIAMDAANVLKGDAYNEFLKKWGLLK